jgi:hypothetical protein
MGRRLRMPAPKRPGASPHSYAALNAAQFGDEVDVRELDDIPLSTRGEPTNPWLNILQLARARLELWCNLRQLFNRASIDVIHCARLSGDLFYHTVRMSCIVVNG